MSTSEDNREAFEELDYASGRSSSDHQEPSNVNTANENTANQNEANKQPAVYQLDWETRDEIMAILNRYTRLFCGQRAEIAIKKNLMNDNMKLYGELISLQAKDANLPSEGHSSNEVTLDLDYDFRSQTVNTLLANHSLVVDGESASEESKAKMIEQNKAMVVALLSLPFSVTASSAKSVLNETIDQSAKPSGLADEVVRLNQIIEKKQAELSDKDAKIFDLGEKVGQLGDLPQFAATGIPGIPELFREMLNDKMGIGKTLNFDYELDGVEAFLKSTKVRLSEQFLAEDLAWYLSFKTKLDGEDEFLSIYLHAVDYAGSSWSINVIFGISILSLSGNQNKTINSITNLSTENSPCCGWDKFITVCALRTGGYIKDNKIKVRVHLKAGKLIRTSW